MAPSEGEVHAQDPFAHLDLEQRQRLETVLMELLKAKDDDLPIRLVEIDDGSPPLTNEEDDNLDQFFRRLLDL